MESTIQCSSHQNNNCPEHQCPICISDFSVNKSKVTLDCGHEFHYKCLLQWNLQDSSSENHQRCPLCRTDLDIKDVIDNHIQPQPSIVEDRQYSFVERQYNSQDISRIRMNEESLGLTFICSDCNSTLSNCENCTKYICRCQYIPGQANKYINHSARSPFDDDSIEHLEEGEIPVMNCAKCFESRDEQVLAYLMDDFGDYDIFTHPQIEYLFEEFYNDTSNDTSNDDLVSRHPIMNDDAFRSYSWDEFTEYIRHIYQNELISQSQNFIDGNVIDVLYSLV